MQCGLHRSTVQRSEDGFLFLGCAEPSLGAVADGLDVGCDHIRDRRQSHVRVTDAHLWASGVVAEAREMRLGVFPPKK